MKLGRNRCPSQAELERAFWSGDDDIRSHADSCPSCGVHWDEIAMLADIGREIQPEPSSDERREEIRAALLAQNQPEQESRKSSPEPERRPWWGWRWQLAMPLAAAAALALLWWTRPAGGPDASQPTLRGTVLEHDEVRYMTAASQPDEIVRLVDGTLTVEVKPLRPGERFRVITSDAEVEVKGTAFDVTAENDRLIAVRVLHGVVEVRPAGGESRELLAGEIWRATDETLARAGQDGDASSEPGAALEAGAEDRVGLDGQTGPALDSVAGLENPTVSDGTPETGARTADTTTRPAIGLGRQTPGRGRSATGEPPSAASPASRESLQEALAGADDPEATPSDSQTPVEEVHTGGDAGPAVAVRSPAQKAFEDGWSAIRSGKFDTAATAFEQAAALDAYGQVEEDARFWRAVALARAGRPIQAGAALELFLTAHAASSRAGEASVMLGWLLFEHGDYQGAAARFRAALDDPSPRIRDRAVDGFDRAWKILRSKQQRRDASDPTAP